VICLSSLIPKYSVGKKKSAFKVDKAKDSENLIVQDQNQLKDKQNSSTKTNQIFNPNLA